MTDAYRSAGGPPPAAIFDLEGALGRLLGNEELLKDLVQFFYEDSPGLLAKIRSGIDAADAGLVERSAHSLRGLAANFGATRTVEAAQRVECLGGAGAPFDQADATMAAIVLEQEVKVLKSALQPFHRGAAPSVE